MIVLATALLFASASMSAQVDTPSTPTRAVETPDSQQRGDLTNGLREMMRLDQLHRTAVSWGTTDPEELARLAALDDEAHLAEAKRRWAAGIRLPKEQEAELMRKQGLLDKANFDRLIGWTRRFGYPDPHRLGLDAPSPVPVFIHARLEWIGPVMDLLEAEAVAGRMPGKEFAALYDRKQQHAGRLQLYGTCRAFDRKTGQVLPPEIEDIDATNRARSALGLPPLAEYRLAKVARPGGVPGSVDR